MIKEQEMLEKELKENFEKDIDTIRNHITSLRLIGVGLSNTLNEKDKEIERLNQILNKAKEKSIDLQKRYGYITDDLTYLLMRGSDKK